jgi:hypothetical protein
MTLGIEQNCIRLRAPRENLSAVVEPHWDRVAALIQENRALRALPDYNMQGRPLSEIIRQARAQLLAAARRWTAAYRDPGPLPDDPTDLIFLAGHQPQMFHPGVWLKNFTLGRLARLHRATAINLIIDSDAVAATSLRVPGGSPQNPSAAMLPFDRPVPVIPYEERRIEDRALFDSFGRRVREQMAGLVKRPLIEKYWPIVVRQSQDTDRLGDCLARARHIIEAQWESATLEIPQSWVCRLDSFHWLVAHLTAQLPRFLAVYNEAVREHRRRYRIRNASHPVPDLATDGDWLEAPFWIWSREDPRRKHLFVKPRAGDLILSDRQNVEVPLPLTDQSDASRAVEQLAELERRGVKIRSRALVTTLWARLVLGDLFLHGIGGANYDCITDRIIQRFFGRKPPGFMVISATLHLPIIHSPLSTNLRSVPGEGRGEGQFKTSPLSSGEGQGEGQFKTSPLSLGEGQGEGNSAIKHPAGKKEDLRAIDHQLRDLTYNPQRYLAGVFHESSSLPGQVQKLIDSKQQWIETHQTIENARTRCQAIRHVNESLQPWVAEQRRQLLVRRDQAAEQLRAEDILTWREYAFCLYPEETLRTFLDSLLPQ